MYLSGTSLARHAQVTPTDATIRSLRRLGGCGSVFGPRNWISSKAVVSSTRTGTPARPPDASGSGLITVTFAPTRLEQRGATGDQDAPPRAWIGVREGVVAAFQVAGAERSRRAVSARGMPVGR